MRADDQHMRPPAPTLAVAVAAALLPLGVGACLSPRTEGGDVEDFARLVAENGEPVVGTEQEGEAEVPPSDDHALADPAVLGEQALEREQEAVAQEPEALLNPYLRFGERIIVREFEGGTTFVTKPYPLPPGKAKKVEDLLDALEPFPFRERPAPNPQTGEGAPLDPAVVQYQILPAWDVEYYSEPSYDAPIDKPPQPPGETNLADLLVVTATPGMLEEFESFLDLFAAGVPQIELEAKIIEIVDTDSFDFGVTPVDGKPIFEFVPNAFVQSLTFTLPNTVDPVEALLTLGAVQDGTSFNAVLQAVSTWQNVTIESRPKTVVRSGALARLESAQEIPFFDIKSVTPQGGFNAVTTYKRVGVKLYIVPRVVGSKTLALEVLLEGSQVVGSQLTVSQVIEGGATAFAPVIAYRTARTVVYLEPGQTLVIGGLTQESKQEVVHKVPILGDIPLLGWLFRSTFDETRREHVIFAISPRIIQTSEFEQEL